MHVGQALYVDATKGVKAPVDERRVCDYEAGLKGTVSHLTNWRELRAKYRNFPGRHDYVPILPSMPPAWQVLGVETAEPRPSSHWKEEDEEGTEGKENELKGEGTMTKLNE
eukprot:GHVU01063927.1.p2 GENE.GHVU01063927.1~~GHVU01063927.1.p2  ORF type:complete len:111 (+),score=17.55 GHVU01063927.1:419-751(+)